jgi:hypothetical protein
MKVEVTTTGATTADFKVLDSIINMETKRKVSRVKDADSYGIMTACWIDGEFITVTDYPITEEMRLKLEKA